MKLRNRIIYNFDGGASHEGVGWGWHRQPDGLARCGRLPHTATSNTAEYTALLWAVTHAVRHYEHFGRPAFSPYLFQGDSKLVVEQVNGRWKCNVPHLVSLRDDVQRSLSGLGDWSVVWIPRDQNKEADAMAWQGKRL